MSRREMIQVCKVEPLPHQHVRITFSDGFVKIVDVGKLVKGSCFEQSFNNPDIFAAVKIYPYGHGIVWPNEFDLCPEMLRYYAEGELVNDLVEHNMEV